jgi:hypothetical protein
VKNKKFIEIEVDVVVEKLIQYEGRVKIKVSCDDFEKDGHLKDSVIKDWVDLDGLDCDVFTERWEIYPQEPDDGWPEDWNET